MKIQVNDIVVVKKGAKDINCHTAQSRAARVLHVNGSEIVAERANGFLTIISVNSVESVNSVSLK